MQWPPLDRQRGALLRTPNENARGEQSSEQDLCEPLLQHSADSTDPICVVDEHVGTLHAVVRENPNLARKKSAGTTRVPLVIYSSALPCAQPLPTHHTPPLTPVRPTSLVVTSPSSLARATLISSTRSTPTLESAPTLRLRITFLTLSGSVCRSIRNSLFFFFFFTEDAHPPTVALPSFWRFG